MPNLPVPSSQTLPAAAAAHIPGPRKAAIIIQMILSEGGSLPLEKLGRDGQQQLAKDFLELKRVDRATLSAVVADLEAQLAAAGLSFPDSVADALAILEGHISPDLVEDLRGRLGLNAPPTPWIRVLAQPLEKIAKALAEEDAKIGAVLLSKLPPEKASTLLAQMEDAQSQAIALAMPGTAALSPDVVARIGVLLSARLPDPPARAFDIAAATRMADILNAARPKKRDAMLEQLAKDDEKFAEEVRAAIFTFADVATRITREDIAKVTRELAQDELIAALVYSTQTAPDVGEFILANMSQRLAETLREEMSERAGQSEEQGEDAAAKLTGAIRRLADSGDIKLQ